MSTDDDQDVLTYDKFIEAVRLLEEARIDSPQIVVIMDPILYQVRKRLPYRLWWTRWEWWIFKLLYWLKGKPYENG